ncbi:hypothetical protein CONLIGDRAFT_635926 [Coniochaeta ligniaria NRRL 30616]|uniref:Uncharacterized protein n=1 Tax=Coniochaeta ligniaria NRRL 30616 TaxID=1408157 RepID=A0A1J7JF03_9PEZI|nr:hypothetical protein CONLIGDRAFT_635926 [Coniochaeta ligniaria NRRL 30616]
MQTLSIWPRGFRQPDPQNRDPPAAASRGSRAGEPHQARAAVQSCPPSWDFPCIDNGVRSCKVQTLGISLRVDTTRANCSIFATIPLHQDRQHPQLPVLRRWLWHCLGTDALNATNKQASGSFEDEYLHAVSCMRLRRYQCMTTVDHGRIQIETEPVERSDSGTCSMASAKRAGVGSEDLNEVLPARLRVVWASYQEQPPPAPGVWRPFEDVKSTGWILQKPWRCRGCRPFFARVRNSIDRDPRFGRQCLAA